MWVSRLRINGGFLGGLDISFVRGLNVVIGSRGVGKTTLLELLRHALGAEHADKARRKQRDQFLTAVLGPGEVIVDLQDENGGTQVIVDAKGRGRNSDFTDSVLVLGQSELEDIASDAANRLTLLDLRAEVRELSIDRSEIGALSREIHRLNSDLRLRVEEAAKRAGLEADRDIYRAQEAALIGDAKGPLATQRDQLKRIEEQSAEIGRRLRTLKAAQDLIARSESTTASLRTALAQLDELVKTNEPEIFPSITHISAAVRIATELTGAISVISLEANEKSQIAREAELKLREVAAPLRESLEASEAGLGQITALIRNVDSQLDELSENDKRIALIEAELTQLHASRAGLFDLVEREEERVYAARQAVAKETSQQIDHHIAVVVEHFGDASAFKDLLTESLRGTHTRSSLIDSLAARVLPRTLLEMVENQDVEGLASAGDLTVDQAARVIASLDSLEGVERLSTVGLEDSVDFLLRDGAVDKSVDNLSTGQKCAVTLPIVLSERHRTLILDQPEDHLDNAYLVDHVVTAMNRRTSDTIQTIVATHNANIPVLGEAGRVFVLASDGRNGEIVESDKFDTPSIVSAITSLMEGGREAFDRRAAFYASKLDSP
jgi:energy-coupling factor transporter ATP-binding protein EcfA2